MEQIKKIKVAIVCHFSNPEVRSCLSLRSLWFRNWIKKTFLHKKTYNYGDFAPWNTLIFDDLGKYEDLDIHVIAPHRGMRKNRETFRMRGITYHFFQIDSSFPFSIFKSENYTNVGIPYPHNLQIIQEIVREISPDIINLIGSENPYYSAAILDMKGYPILLSCQTVYSNPTRKEHDKMFSQKRWDIEQNIFKKADFFACMGELHKELVLKYKPDAIVFKLVFPHMDFPKLMEVEKKYDFVYYAQEVSVKKGVNNAVEALSIVKKLYPNVSLLIVGSNHEPYKSVLDARIAELGLENNIVFHGYFPKQIDMLQYVKQARFALLPIKMDIVSGTIIQAMEMGLPVVTHITSGTPALNKDEECVLLSKIDDDQKTAENMKLLMESPELAERLRQNSYTYIKRKNNEAKRAGDLWQKQYKAVYDNYYNKKDIPEDLIYR